MEGNACVCVLTVLYLLENSFPRQSQLALPYFSTLLVQPQSFEQQQQQLDYVRRTPPPSSYNKLTIFLRPFALHFAHLKLIQRKAARLCSAQLRVQQ
jgi:hypothetical protein